MPEKRYIRSVTYVYDTLVSYRVVAIERDSLRAQQVCDKLNAEHEAWRAA